MGEVKQINIKNRTYYFYNHMINIKNFELNLLKIDRKSYKNIGIYNIRYITIKRIDHCKNIYSVNPNIFTNIHIYSCYSCKLIYQRKKENKYLIFHSTDENKELLKNSIMFGMEFKKTSKQ